MARARRILPGFGLSLGFVTTYLSLIVLIPLAVCVLKATQISWADLSGMLTSKRIQAAFWISFSTALIAAIINALAGVPVAWALTRYRFPFRRIIDSLIDFPFALPTAVAGLTFADLFTSNDTKHGWLADGINGWGWNRIIADPLTHLINAIHPGTLEPDSLYGIHSPTAIVLVLVFTGFPFVVRTVQPVLEDLDPEIEEAAACLGANRFYTLRRIILPLLLPAWLTGFALAFARGIGEYGSIVFVSGSIRERTEIVPMIIFEKLDQFKYVDAAALAVMLLIISFACLMTINFIAGRQRRIE
jgi:sulfate transport system permease protein